MSVISFCDMIICTGWSHTLCTVSMGSVYLATCNNTGQPLPKSFLHLLESDAANCWVQVFSNERRVFCWHWGHLAMLFWSGHCSRSSTSTSANCMSQLWRVWELGVLPQSAEIPTMEQLLLLLLHVLLSSMFLGSYDYHSHKVPQSCSETSSVLWSVWSMVVKRLDC